MMRFEDCFRLLHARLKTELIVTSAGNTSELWWEISRETERVFYLEASMSLASLFAAGIAYGNPEKTVVAFSGDGAFNMNPGMLFVERQLDLPNLKHFMVSNRCYGSTNELAMPFSHSIDYAAMARAAGLLRVYSLATLEELERQLDEIIRLPATPLPCCMSSRSAATRRHRPWTDRKSNFGSAVISGPCQPALSS